MELISVEEGLPEIGESVSVLVKGQICFVDATRTENNGWQDDRWHIHRNVTHWRRHRASSEPESAGWISVKERLPENVAPVIACQAGAENNAYEAIYCRGEWWQGCAPARPTHWMPYPEPPEAESLPQFYTEEIVGILPRIGMCFRGHGSFWSVFDRESAQELCDQLNRLWQQQGTTEEHHDDNTTTDCREHRPTACGDHCRTDK